MRKVTVTVLVLIVAAAIGWQATYPSESDPKNIKYVLWKHGLLAMNLDVATGTMIGDPGREKLIVGKTKLQLQQKFGYLPPPAEASSYLRGCYENSTWKNQDVLFIRKSPWMIVFDGEKAKELVLVKGC
jgi:hypothetical protein